MKKFTWVAVVTLSFIAALVASNQASATDYQAPVCYDQITESMYERQVPTYGDVINKETRTILKVKDGRTHWSDWTDWPDADPVKDDGRNRGPAAHNKVEPGTKGYREYRYVVVDQFINGSETENSGWVTEAPEGDGWELVDTREVDGEEIDCPPPPTTEPPPTTQPPTTEPPVTTAPPTTEPPTTEPPTTEPPVTTAPTTTVAVGPPPTIATTTTLPRLYVEVCILNDGSLLNEGQYQIVTYDLSDGTTRYGILPCRRPVTPPDDPGPGDICYLYGGGTLTQGNFLYVTQDQAKGSTETSVKYCAPKVIPTQTVSLPATGTNTTLFLVMAGLVLMLAGLVMVRWEKENR